MEVRRSRKSDGAAVFNLYKKVAEQGGGIARMAHEVSLAYVDTFLNHSIDNGIGLVIIHPEDKSRSLPKFIAISPN